MAPTAPTDDPNDLTSGPTAAQPNFWDTWGKPIGTAAGVGAGMYFGKRAQDAAAVRSPEELAAMNAMQGPGGSPATAASLMQESRPYISKPASYYQTLLNGNRAAMAQVTAPQRAALNESYRGAATNVIRSGARGAQREQLTGDLNRQRAGAVAGLTTGVQPQAAAALAGLGQGLQQTAVPLYGNATNFYAQMLNNGLQNRQFAAKEGSDTGAQFGKLAADIGNTKFGKGKKPAAAGGAPPEPPFKSPGPGQPGVLAPGPGGFQLPNQGVFENPPDTSDPGQYGWPIGTNSGWPDDAPTYNNTGSYQDDY